MPTYFVYPFILKLKKKDKLQNRCHGPTWGYADPPAPLLIQYWTQLPKAMHAFVIIHVE